MDLVQITYHFFCTLKGGLILIKDNANHFFTHIHHFDSLHLANQKILKMGYQSRKIYRVLVDFDLKMVLDDGNNLRDNFRDVHRLLYRIIIASTTYEMHSNCR